MRLPLLFITQLLIALPSIALADPWDDKVNQWRKESAFLKEADLPVLEKQAAQGDVRAIYLLYRELDSERYGYKGSPGSSKVGALAKKLAESGNPVGMAALCSMRLNGNGGMSKDDAQAKIWCEKSANQGLGVGMLFLGWMYRNGRGVPKNDALAFNWYRKSVEAGNYLAMKLIGFCYANGDGVNKDEAEAIKWFRRGAEFEDPIAITYLGWMYESGSGVHQDHSEAVKLYRKGADLGDSRAMNNLGWAYYQGNGVAQDYIEAFKWFRKAADAGDSLAMKNLGFCFANGLGVSKNHAEAERWYRNGAEAGESRAMALLGSMYQNGMGVKQDLAEAVKWFRKSAEAGDGEGMSNLGASYEHGYGVGHDYVEAVKWYRKGAEIENGSAMANLGGMYRSGFGVPKDYIQAARWFAKALKTKSDSTYANGETADQRARRLLDEMIAKGQITDAAVRQEVAAVFKPAPKAEWTSLPSSTNTENTEIVLRLSDAGGGIGDIQLFIDGAIVDRNASRDFGVEATKDLTRRSFTVKLPEGRHDIKIRAYAAENIGNFTELSGSITSTWKKISKPKLHLIAVGVNEFTEKDLNLKYAQADAKAVYDSLNKQIGGLYDKGETRLLLGRESAGKQAIINAIRAVQQNSQFDDVFVFYAASHGKNYESGGYYLLTSDVAAKAADKVKPSSLSYIELRDLFSQVKSRKKFVLLDTCHAGQSIKADDLVGTRGLKDDEQDLMDSLKQRSGATVLMAAELEQKAFEGYQGHGLFTYALLEAIGAAPANNSKLGNVRNTDEIMMHVESRVPQLAKEVFKAEQKTYASKAGAGFPLVKLGNP